MTIQRQDFDIKVGEDQVLTFALTDGQGQPFDATGMAARWRLGREAGGPALVEKTAAAGITLANATAKVRLTDADTVGMEGVYHHQLRITDGSGDDAFVATGLGIVGATIGAIAP